MHPTIDEQLDGAQRLLVKVAEGDELSRGSRELLENVRRLLGHVERSWAQQLSFHNADSEETLALLSALAPLIEGESALSGSATAQTDPLCAADPRGAAARNAEVRGLLSGAIAVLPSTDEGRAARETIVHHLLRRLESDPSWKEAS